MSAPNRKGLDPNADLPKSENVPRWRQIEILEERRRLKDMLDDFDGLGLDVEQEVFGSEEENDIYFRPSEGDPEDDEVGLDEDVETPELDEFDED